MKWEILTPAIGLLGGIAGYLLREYKNRIKPFVQIQSIDGALTKRSDSVTLSKEVLDKIKETFYIKPLEEQCDMGEIYDRWDRADDVEKMWPQVRRKLEKALASKSDDDLVESLKFLFSSQMFEIWMLKLLLTDRIKFESLPGGLTEKIEIFSGSEHNGCVWISFPNRTMDFGQSFSNIAIKAKCKPLLDSIRYLQRKPLLTIFKQYRKLLEDEHHAAVSVLPDLKRIKDEHSRWSFQIFFANLSAHPVIIENSAKIEVFDKTRVRLGEDSYIALQEKKEDGTYRIVDTQNPLVVRGGGDASFYLITSRIQAKMDMGNALREIFERSQGKCRFHLHLRKVGLIKKQKYKTRFYPFKEFVSAEKTAD